ncbi:(deoxy)nucleoside triphosphate pyrophosphohydrolase [Fusobacterium sp.]|uniref:(deoxy)nucleoside triphosphate pyrophosphohydrolase n=1 Tax=Fusobacterium sp. TaxID=68766 RepID=UPI00261367D2|nr:(deoxy)nucleoside triphosphate pyrophosphohydrolase [Fusobacterium sp.]
MKKIVKVVGAIIINEDDKILCTLRNKNKSLGNMWEFPGGKIEPGETLEEALKRELKEELELNVNSLTFFTNVVKEYENFIIDLTCFKCKILNNETYILKEHQAALWLNKENLSSLVWVPTDYPVVENLMSE